MSIVCLPASDLRMVQIHSFLVIEPLFLHVWSQLIHTSGDLFLNFTKTSLGQATNICTSDVVFYVFNDSIGIILPINDKLQLNVVRWISWIFVSSLLTFQFIQHCLFANMTCSFCLLNSSFTLMQPVYRRYLGNTDEMLTIRLEILVLGEGVVGGGRVKGRAVCKKKMNRKKVGKKTG